MIPRIAHPWSPGTYPYEALAGAAITPASSHAAVLDGVIPLQAAGTFSQDMRRAWDELLSLPRRLAIDFFLFNPDWCEPENPTGAALRQLAGGAGNQRSRR
jgi:hypothetical protein